MAWEMNGDDVRFTGPIADLMTVIMNHYEEDAATPEFDGVEPGVYVTAVAVVLREVLLESLEENEEAAEFVARITGAVAEDEGGNINVATLDLLDDIAEHIDLDAVTRWFTDPTVRSAMIDLVNEAFV